MVSSVGSVVQKCLNAQGRMFSQPLVVRGELIGRSPHVLRIGHLDAAAHEAHGESDAGVSASVSREVRRVVMAERAKVPRLFPDLHRLDHIHLALVDEHFAKVVGGIDSREIPCAQRRILTVRRREGRARWVGEAHGSAQSRPCPEPPSGEWRLRRSRLAPSHPSPSRSLGRRSWRWRGPAPARRRARTGPASM